MTIYARCVLCPPGSRNETRHFKCWKTRTLSKIITGVVFSRNWGVGGNPCIQRCWNAAGHHRDGGKNLGVVGLSREVHKGSGPLTGHGQSPGEGRVVVAVVIGGPGLFPAQICSGAPFYCCSSGLSVPSAPLPLLFQIVRLSLRSCMINVESL